MVSHMPNDCEPTTGAWSCHVGHWYALTVPSSGSWHRSNSDYCPAGGRHVEKMVRIKQTLIKSTQTEGGNNQRHQSDGQGICWSDFKWIG